MSNWNRGEFRGQLDVLRDSLFRKLTNVCLAATLSDEDQTILVELSSYIADAQSSSELRPFELCLSRKSYIASSIPALLNFFEYLLECSHALPLVCKELTSEWEVKPPDRTNKSLVDLIARQLIALCRRKLNIPDDLNAVPGGPAQSPSTLRSPNCDGRPQTGHLWLSEAGSVSSPSMSTSLHSAPIDLATRFVNSDSEIANRGHLFGLIPELDSNTAELLPSSPSDFGPVAGLVARGPPEALSFGLPPRKLYWTDAELAGLLSDDFTEFSVTSSDPRNQKPIRRTYSQSDVTKAKNRSFDNGSSLAVSRAGPKLPRSKNEAPAKEPDYKKSRRAEAPSSMQPRHSLPAEMHSTPSPKVALKKDRSYERKRPYDTSLVHTSLPGIPLIFLSHRSPALVWLPQTRQRRSTQITPVQSNRILESSNRGDSGQTLSSRQTISPDSAQANFAEYRRLKRNPSSPSRSESQQPGNNHQLSLFDDRNVLAGNLPAVSAGNVPATNVPAGIVPAVSDPPGEIPASNMPARDSFGDVPPCDGKSAEVRDNDKGQEGTGSNDLSYKNKHWLDNKHGTIKKENLFSERQLYGKTELISDLAYDDFVVELNSTPGDSDTNPVEACTS